jgi:hypothetical protein
MMVYPSLAPVPTFIPLSLEVRSVEQDAHKHTSNGTSNRDCHDPGDDQEADSLPVDGIEGSIAKTNTDGGAGDAHGC